MTTRQRLEALTSDLVRIDARNAWLIPGGPGEEEIARWIARQVESVGVAAELEAYAPGHPNVIARLGGGSPVLGFNAHMDTVGDADWPDRAFEPTPDGNRLVGWGPATTMATAPRSWPPSRFSSSGRRAGEHWCSRGWPTRKASRVARPI